MSRGRESESIKFPRKFKPVRNPLKTLIAVTSCHAFRARADAVRETWGGEVAGADVRYFLGEGTAERPDEIVLPCPDGYHYLSQKTQLIRRWALAQGYDYLWKVDDDVYLRPERLLENGLMAYDYVGRLRGPCGSYPAPYCSGFLYGLSRRALEAIAPIEWDGSDDFSEDRWTGNQLLKRGISPTRCSDILVEWSKNNAISGREPPMVGNKIIASCEYSPDKLRLIHAQFKAGNQSQMTDYVPPQGSLSRVSVLIKTFLRDGYLMACLDGLEKNFPDCKIVVVDDGDETREKITRAAEMRRKGHAWINLPFDSGFGAKANAAIADCAMRKYTLIGSDDFDFSDPRVRPGVEAMVKVLDNVPALGVVSGRVNANPYEFCWDVFERGLKEVPRYHCSGEVQGVKYHVCDLTVNFSLLRSKMFHPDHGGIRWDGGSVKMGGGEHSAFFVDVQRFYWSVAYVEGANIYEFKENFTWKDKRYTAMRGRARTPGRPCLKARGIDTYILGDGTVELS